MILNTCKYNFLALVPHRDTRLLLRSWSASAFNASCPGAWSFPYLVPIAQLASPIKAKDLKQLGIILRNDLNRAGGKIVSLEAGSIKFPLFSSEKTYLYGNVLNINISGDFYALIEKSISMSFSQLVLGAALMEKPVYKGAPPPETVFRAAALANMEITPMQNIFSLEWKIGRLYWLPRSLSGFAQFYKKNAKKHGF